MRYEGEIFCMGFGVSMMQIACEASDGVSTAISSVEIEIRLEVDLV